MDRSSRDHDLTTSTALEGYPVEVLLDALADAERDAAKLSLEHIPTSKARAYCAGRAAAFRAAWELVLRHRPIRPLEGALSSAKPALGDGSRDEPCPSCLRLSNELEEARKYEALGRACEAHGLGWYIEDGTMRFQPPAEFIAEQAGQTAELALEQAKRERDEAMVDAIAAAFEAGCWAVQGNYRPDSDPEFGEAARDYACSVRLSLPAGKPGTGEVDLVGAAGAEVGRYVYRRIEALMGAKPGTPEGAELVYLAAIAESVEEYGEEACAGHALALPPAAGGASSLGEAAEHMRPILAMYEQEAKVHLPGRGRERFEALADALRTLIGAAHALEKTEAEVRADLGKPAGRDAEGREL